MTTSRIVRISQNSPLGVEMEGIGDAVATMRELIVPWRRAHAKKMAELDEKQKQAEVARLETEILEGRIKMAQARVDTKIAEEELEQKKLTTERMRFENEHLKVELRKEKIDLALIIVERCAPNLSSKERVEFVVQLLKSLTVLVESPLELETKP